MGPKATPNVAPVAQFVSEPWFLMSMSVYQEITEVEPSAKSTLQFSPLGELDPGVVIWLSLFQDNRSKDFLDFWHEVSQ